MEKVVSHSSEQPCPHLHFRLLASSPITEYTSVFKLSSSGALLCSPSKWTRGSSQLLVLELQPWSKKHSIR